MTQDSDKRLILLQQRNYDLQETILKVIEILKEGNIEKALKILKRCYMKNKLYLLLKDLTTNKQFFKYFETEYEMDKFKRKLKFSKKIMLIEDSRDNWVWYDD